MKFFQLPLCLLIFANTVTDTQASVKLPAVFDEHMVLQRDTILPIWGWASPGERVEVSLGAQSGSAVTNADGKWIVRLQPQAASKNSLTLTVKGSNTIEIKDVLLGDLWLCSGQSNMDFSLGSVQATDDIKSANFPLIRHFRTTYHFASAPADDLNGKWSVCSPGTASGFTAVGYYFARKVHAETGVPIGLLTNAVGGTNIELWMSQETLLNTPSLESYAKIMRESLDQYQKDLTDALPAIEQWMKLSKANLAASKPLPLPPEWPESPFSERRARPRCVTLHNGHIAPLVPMAMRGVLWYQGENNASDSNVLLYVEKKRAMLADWRKWFGNPNLPFYFVQLASFQAPSKDPAGGGWGPIRDAQRRCLEIPHTGMASAVDVGDANDIHPKNKFDVGERLARWALVNEYGKKDTVVSGPLLREMKVEGSKARITFDSIGGGLMTGRKEGRTPATETKGAKLEGFAIAGENKQWQWADAVIDGDTVLVSSPQVPSPAAVRYAYSSNPVDANLYNRAGLPASPFRTDKW